MKNADVDDDSSGNVGVVSYMDTTSTESSDYGGMYDMSYSVC